MASTSASSIQKSFTYDVFLSFRGEDTRKNFVDNLYHALKQNGIYTYRDDEEIRKGKKISDELIRSIEDSRFYIIVFSKNYASSSWCLDELVKIMECQKTNEQTAYPVFYDVDPTEVRKQTGAVGEAFAKHKEHEAAEKWRDALREATDLAGWELKNTFDGHEAKFIQRIVDEISLQLRLVKLSVDGTLVGMKKRVKDVVSSLATDIDDVRMIGIKGIGGGGKTTLAGVVFDQLSIMFEGSSFVENVRENSKNPLCGLKLLQKQVLSDVLNKQDIIINSVYEGKNMMKQRMRGKKILVVLDDVDHIDQLEALAGKPNWFKPGSRVIITTREEQVLVAHGVPKNLILDVSLLSDEESNSLFNRYAFGKEIPNQGYEMLASQVVCYAAGLPLTIRVLGSFLRGKDELEWADALERLKTIPLKETLEILELSYYSLEEDYKEMFLDIACLLKGWKKERAIRVLESSGFHARSGLRVLEQKSLITISTKGCLSMHDHLEEMGKNIVRRLHPDDPSTHSRLWIGEEIQDILVKNKGTEATQCIKAKLVNPFSVKKGFQNMEKLRFLDVIYGIKEIIDLDFDGYDSDIDYSSYYYGDYSYLDNKDIGKKRQHLPNGLRYLCLIGYPYTGLSEHFQANNLVGLEICFSNINHFWNGGEIKVLKKLRFFDLCFCKLKTLDIRLLPNLERLNLVACENLLEIHMPVENLKLKYLHLCRSKLRILDLTHAQDLDTLKVKKCEDLEELHFPNEYLKFKHLSLHWSRLKTLNLRRYHNLETLDLVCEDLVELHMPVENFYLKSFNLRRSKLTTLDIGRAQHLNNFNIEDNTELLELHWPTTNVKCVSLDHPKMKTLHLTRTRNLETLHLVNCVDLLELHMPNESSELKSIYIGCPKLETLKLTQAWNLKILDLIECDDLRNVHMPIKSYMLTTIYMSSCPKLETLDLTWAQNLETLHLEKCNELLELRMPIECFKLRIIHIFYCRLESLNLTGTQNLEMLGIARCEDLQNIHMPIESPKLKLIYIHCTNLRAICLGLSPCLEFLFISECFSLVEVEVCAPLGCLIGRVRFKPFLVNQDFPMVSSSAELHLIIQSFSGICPLHPGNNFPKFRIECTYEGLQLSSILNLMKLISFGPCACTNLASLSEIISGLQCSKKLTIEGSIPEVPKELVQLECLEELTLLSTEIEHLPDSICMLKHLKVLQLKSCRFLKQLPEDLDRLECLEVLHLVDCKSLQDIPSSICEMKRLKCFHLVNCKLVNKLPKEMGLLTCLRELCIEGTSIVDLPESIFQLENLTFFL